MDMKAARAYILSLVIASTALHVSALTLKPTPTYSDIWERADLVVVADVDSAKDRVLYDSPVAAHYGDRRFELQCTVELVLKGTCPSNSISVHRDYYYINHEWYDRISAGAAGGDRDAEQQMRDLKNAIGGRLLSSERDVVSQCHSNSYLLFLNRDRTNETLYHAHGRDPVLIPLPKRNPDMSTDMAGEYEGWVYIGGQQLEPPEASAIRTPVRIVARRAGVHRMAFTITFAGEKRLAGISLPDTIESGVIRLDKQHVVQRWWTGSDLTEVTLAIGEGIDGIRGTVTKSSSYPDGSWGPVTVLRISATRKKDDQH
jgi:hypothetical protein